jgi:hypothetical protein
MWADHHRPGDPGFGRPPADFLPASSVGQVLQILACRQDWNAGEDSRWYSAPGALYFVEGGWHLDTCYGTVDVSREIILTAAADHCLGAAYRRACPGVDPDELATWRAESRATFQGRTVAAVLADVEETRAALRAAPMLVLTTLRDMRRETPWPELPEAGAREGVGYASGPLRGPDGKEKWTCSGTPKQVRGWLIWAQLQGLRNPYGDPERGFAGAYAP